MIQATTSTPQPPRSLVHQYSAEKDSLDDLNAWVSAYFQPLFSAPHDPGFANVDGTLRYLTGSVYSTDPIPDGFWIVVSPGGNIHVIADDDFQVRYTSPTPA